MLLYNHGTATQCTENDGSRSSYKGWYLQLSAFREPLEGDIDVRRVHARDGVYTADQTSDLSHILASNYTDLHSRPVTLDNSLTTGTICNQPEWM